MIDWENFYSALRQPDFLPGYEILNRLGGGAFGEVYRARKQSIGKDYAVKFLKVEVEDGGPAGQAADANQDGQSMIERELGQAELFASIDHPNLVAIEDLGQVGGVPYLLMGYAGEDTLARRLKRGPLEEEEAFRIFVQVCRGVLALHDRGLAHFDLKPSNIFLRGETARVGDYGLAKLLSEGRQTLSFGRGTPLYMAPEMLKARADTRADIYSLGVILYECLVGKLPFEADSGLGLLLRPDDSAPEFPTDFDPRLRESIARCLRVSPDDRYGSVADLLVDLQQAARPGDSIVLSSGERAAAGRGARPSHPGQTARENLGREVLEWETLEGSSGGAAPLQGAPPAGVAPVAAAWTDRPDPAAVLPEVSQSPIPPPLPRRAPAAVPVPPAIEGGAFETATALGRVGLDLFGATVASPALAIGRWVGRATGGAVRQSTALLWFVALCVGFGALVALVFVGLIMRPM